MAPGSTGGRWNALSNTPHQGPQVLWSQIRLAPWPNYSQSEPIKANYCQLWPIKMPRRLIAGRDGAAVCHIEETVTLIACIIIFLLLHWLTLSLYMTQHRNILRDACWLKKRIDVWLIKMANYQSLLYIQNKTQICFWLCRLSRSHLLSTSVSLQSH